MDKYIGLLFLGLIVTSCTNKMYYKPNILPQQKPNILLIITDDQGYADFSAYGGADDVSTPSMDEIANNGLRFTNAYATAPVCNASRAGIITGKYQERWGTFYYEGNIFPKTIATIPELLKEEGYRCVKVGKTHYSDILDNNIKIKQPLSLREFPLNHGYEEFMGFCAHRHDYFKLMKSDRIATDPDDDRMSQYGPLWVNREKKDFDGYLTNIFGDEAVNQINKKDERPFFMELSFNAVHHPIYQAPDKYLKKFGIEKFPDWEPEKESFLDYHARTCWMGETDPDGRKRYLANLACLDDNIGKVISALKKSGKWENTLVIFISDNGGSQNTYANNGELNGHKYILTEGGIRTPFAMSWPEKIKKNQVIHQAISHMDIMPTVLAASGSKIQDSISFDGKNLLPWIQNPIQELHQELVWDTGNEWAVRQGNWKLHIVKKDNKFRSIDLNAGTYLFNLEMDPGEKNNLALQEAEKVKELTHIYKAWRTNIDAIN
ncbi:sulfatase [Wocania ichthyoenteri]|uniref:sulfatase family protein n=1 Tax=Wocania ichthyoenteri TaxID=1230531 RepID=UPI000A6E3600|nr:sulfatase-like hydrolase/transferase [Wocania ichthyoenteri]